MLIERKITINLYYESEENLDFKKADEIEEEAKQHIADCIKDGYTSGEIITNIADGRGWWSLTTECV